MSRIAMRGRRVVVLCEGDTEELAVRYFLARQWAADGLRAVGLDRDNLNGDLQAIGTRTGLYLDEPDVLGVFTLIDLYGMNKVKHSAADDLETKVRRVHSWLKSQVAHGRSLNFYPHVSVHEIEAWILAEGSALAKRLNDQAIVPDPNAELKNFQQPPSKRINDLFLSRKKTRYQKIIDGRPLFSELNFESIYGSCRYFKAFYDQLRAVASQALSAETAIQDD